MTEQQVLYVADNTLSLPGNLTATGWQPPANLPYDHWERNIRLLVQLRNASRFWLGDGLEFGEHTYGDKYAQAVDDTGLSYGRLANIAYTCRRVDSSRRRESLSFEHHTVVAPLPPDEQEYWLHWAEFEQSSSRELEDAIAESRGDPPPRSYTDKLERANGDLRARVAQLESQVDDPNNYDLDPVDEAYSRDAGGGQVTCPECGAIFEIGGNYEHRKRS